MAKWLIDKLIVLIAAILLCLGTALPVFAVSEVVVKVAVSDYPNYLSFDNPTCRTLVTSVVS